MKTLVFILLTLISINAFCQTPAKINLKNGDVIDAYHFGQEKCGNNIYMKDNFIILRGKYKDVATEIKDYSKIAKMVCTGFSKEPVAEVGNEKGKIKVYKTNGLIVMLDEAELVMSCYGHGDLYNQVIVQIVNPLTEEIMEKKIDMKEINSIEFNQGY